MTIGVELTIQTRKSLKSFTKRPYRMPRLKTYCDLMSKDRLGTLYDDNVADALKAQGYQFDESPRSVYRVDKLFSALSQYAPNTIPDFISDDNVSAGISLAYAAFAKPSSNPYLRALDLTPETIVKITSNPSGSPGVTNYGCSKVESMVRALERGVQTLKGDKQPEPCLAFARTQFNDKTRLVWGYPYSMTVLEGLVAYPLIKEFKKGCTPMAFAMPSGALGTKLRVSSYHKEWAYSLDMSQFDATLSKSLIRVAFKILRTWFDLSQLEPYSGKSVRELFDLVEHFFIHTTIVMPDGRLYIGKDHGVPSGSYFTQMIDSIVNVIICGTLSSKFKLHVSKDELFVLGDDLMFWTNRKIELKTLATYANSKFHVKLNAEKSQRFHFDDELHYLGRDWSNGLPDLDVSDIIKRMVFPERFRRYSPNSDLKRKQVRMLILSYASVYKHAWQIAYDLLDGSHTNIAKGCANLDVNTYCYGPKQDSVDPDHLSGLVRYQRKYLFHKARADIPITALQYWL